MLKCSIISFIQTIPNLLRIDHIDDTFFAKHSGRISGMLRNNISQGPLVLLHEKDVSLKLDHKMS